MLQRHGEIGLLYEIDDCVASINRTIDTYFKLPRTGLDVYDALSTPVQINVVQFSTNPRRALPDKKGRAGKLKGLDIQTCTVSSSAPRYFWLSFPQQLCASWYFIPVELWCVCGLLG